MVEELADQRGASILIDAGQQSSLQHINVDANWYKDGLRKPLHLDQLGGKLSSSVLPMQIGE